MISVPRHAFALLALVAAAAFLSTACATPPGPDPFHLMVVLGEEGSTEMGVHWQTMEHGDASIVRYDTTPREGDPDAYAFEARGSQRTIDGLPDGRQVHGAMLTDLEPGTVYYFIAGNPTVGFSAEKSFRTPPGGDEPVRFVIGGDMGVKRSAEQLVKLAGEQDPDLIVVGGDLAYANGELSNIGTWDRWFDYWTTLMVTSEGHLVPLIAGIGNHETNKIETEDWKVKAPFFTGFFWLQGEAPYFTRRINDYMAFILLDSDHLVRHMDQVDFLQEELERHADFPAVFPVYHVPLYPGHRDFLGGGSAAGRQHWMPLFEEHGIRVAFENHDHVAKRTHPLRGGEIDPEGIVYIGDGTFGVNARDVEPRWYLDMIESRQHFWVVDVTPEQVALVAIDINGQAFDQITLPLRAYALAE